MDAQIIAGIIGATASIVAVIVALYWTEIQASHRARRFKRLIFRELREIGPHPSAADNEPWWKHQNRTFIHQKIITSPSENRDFILSLEPELIYQVSQLWAALEAKNAKQWLYFLQKLSHNRYHDREKEIEKAYLQWVILIYTPEPGIADTDELKNCREAAEQRLKTLLAEQKCMQPHRIRFWGR